MKLYEITLQEHDGFERCGELLDVAIPLPVGLVRDARLLELAGAAVISPIAATPTGTWPDGSVRWCVLRCRVSLAANANETLMVSLRSVLAESDGRQLQISSSGAQWCIDTGRLCLTSDSEPQWRVVCGERHFLLNVPRLQDAEGRPCLSILESTEMLTDANAVTATLRQQGWFKTQDGERLCRFEAVLEAFVDSTHLHCQFKVHNPRAAQHPGGVWDLGDPGSCWFQECTLDISFSQPSVAWAQLTAQDDWLPVSEQGEFQQVSSGGVHWDSRNHVDASGELNVAFRGYRFSTPELKLEGQRAAPLLFSEAGVSVYLRHCWEQFPKGTMLTPERLILQLFPARPGRPHELQGGESKTHCLDLDFSGNRAALMWARAPLAAPVDRNWLIASGNLLYPSTGEPMDALIGIALDPQVGLLAKREAIDEYGWRNFGDLFADHESLYLPEGQHYVSHYNNQYDALYGLQRQYLLSGDARWWSLADELARHVVDIDIYNTVEDRPEYNGGLFWHTDHYVDALTSSHRTYSRLQRHVNGAVTQGGGPGPEHCYTHGLALHHFLTGSPASRAAVLSLVHWMIRIYEGSGTLFEQLLRIKAQILPRWRSAAGRSVMNHELPMNRGVGNYLNALLDACLLTGDTQYLARADAVIQMTAHPQDKIADRHFDNIELTWHYTVFLQSVIRFVEHKQQRQEGQDAATQYALAVVLHYAEWMAHHETPYLDQPERLEFPNDTWAAQDLRKAHILYFASIYTGSIETAAFMRARADVIHDHVVMHLGRSPTRHFVRILVILLQNHGPTGYYRNRQRGDVPVDRIGLTDQGDRPYAKRLQLVAQACRMLLRAMSSFSLRREIEWLSHRSSTGAALYRRLYGRSVRR